MERDKFKLLIKGLKAVYVQTTFIPDADAFDMWYALLGDLDYEVCAAAIKKYILLNKFPPTVAEIRELSSNITHGEPIAWGSSWECVMKAIRKYGFYQEQEAIESLDPLTRRCVQTIGFQNLCLSENLMADRAHYQRVFESYSKQDQTERKMPLALTDEINRLLLKNDNPGFARIGVFEKGVCD